MIQWLRILAANSGKQSLILRPLIMEGSPSGCPLTAMCVPWGALVCMRAHTRMVKKKLTKSPAISLFLHFVVCVLFNCHCLLRELKIG